MNAAHQYGRRASDQASAQLQMTCHLLDLASKLQHVLDCTGHLPDQNHEMTYRFAVERTILGLKAIANRKNRRQKWLKTRKRIFFFDSSPGVRQGSWNRVNLTPDGR